MSTNLELAPTKWSKAADTAIEIKQLLRPWRDSLDYLNCDHTSEEIATRWAYLKSVISSIRVHGDRFSQSIMASIESKLEHEMKMLDMINMEIETRGEVGSLKEQISEYANVIIMALKTYMDDAERERFELEY